MGKDGKKYGKKIGKKKRPPTISVGSLNSMFTRQRVLVY